MKGLYSKRLKRTVWSNEGALYAQTVRETDAEVGIGPGRATNIVTLKDRRCAETQFPKNYKYHAEAGGSFDENGVCLFDSWDQIERTVGVANDHGEKVQYDQPFRRIGSLD